MALRHSPKIVTDGLLRCLDIGNDRSYPGSGSTITDLSNSENNGTNNGASYNSDDPKNFSFSTNDYISGTSFYNSRDAGSVEVWFQHNQSAHSQFGMLYFEGTSNGFGSQKEMHLGVDTSGVLNIFFEGGGSTDVNFNQSGSISANTWTCATATFTGLSSNRSAKLYVNGTLEGSTGADGKYAGSSASSVSYIGRTATTISDVYRGLVGKIAIVRCYSKQLSDAEVSQNYNALKGRFGL
jgi:hypothetical protein